MRLQQTIYKMSMAIILLASVITIYIGYLLFYPVKVIEMKEPLLVDKHEVLPGDGLNITLNYCKHIDSPANVTVYFVGNNLSPMYTAPKNLTMGCHVDIFPVQVPIASASGMRIIELSFQYQVNRIRTETYHFQTEPFRVMEKTPAQQEIFGIGSKEVK